MEWLIGIYLAIGVVRALNTLANPSPGRKPLWMMTERNPLRWTLFFTLYVIGWPLPRR